MYRKNLDKHEEETEEIEKEENTLHDEKCPPLKNLFVGNKLDVLAPSPPAPDKSRGNLAQLFCPGRETNFPFIYLHCPSSWNLSRTPSFSWAEI